MAKKPQKPKQPNVSRLGNEQLRLGGRAARLSQKINALPQTVPGGQLIYKTGKHGNIKGIKVKLDPAQQQFYDTSTAARQAAVGALPKNPFTQPIDTTSGAVRDALYKRKIGMIEPQLQQAEAENQRMLMERGIPIGSEVYGNERERLAQERENLYTSAAQDAELAAGAESDRVLAQALTVRNQPYNEYASMVSGTSIPSPGFQSVPGYSVGAPDVFGAAQNQYQQQMQDYNQAQQSGWGGLFGLGAAGISRLPFLRA